MSLSVDLVPGNPNPKALTMRVNANLLGEGLGKIVVTRTGTLVNHVPLARFFFGGTTGQSGGDLTRIDLSVEEDGSTLIALSRKLMPWQDAQKQKAVLGLSEFLRRGLTPVFTQAIKDNVEVKPRFHASNSIEKLVKTSFDEQVNPRLAHDGGAMELMKVDHDSLTGVFQAQVALIGSCNGCSSAQTQTLGAATANIREVLEEVKKLTPNNEVIQRLSFAEIGILDIPEIALSL